MRILRNMLTQICDKRVQKIIQANKNTADISDNDIAKEELNEQNNEQQTLVYAGKGFTREYTVIGNSDSLSDKTKELIDNLNLIETLREQKLFYFERLYTAEQLRKNLQYKVLKYLELNQEYSFKDIQRLLGVYIEPTDVKARHKLLTDIFKYVVFNTSKIKNKYIYVPLFYRFVDTDTAKTLDYYKRHTQELMYKTVRYNGYYIPIPFKRIDNKLQKAKRLQKHLIANGVDSTTQPELFEEYSERRFVLQRLPKPNIGNVVGTIDDVIISVRLQNGEYSQEVVPCVQITYGAKGIRLVLVNAITQIVG